MNAILLNMVKSLPLPLLIGLFLDIAETMAKRTDNTLDDQAVKVLRAAFAPQSLHDDKVV